MVKKLPVYSPFYAAYAPQAAAIQAAVAQAAKESATKMGAQFSLVYSLRDRQPQEIKLAA